MEIVCESKRVMRDDTTLGLSEGDYLVVKTLPLGKEFFITRKKFIDLYETGKRQVTTSIDDPGLGTVIEEIEIQAGEQRLDFKDLMEYLKQEIEIGEDFAGNQEVSIQADSGEFLELPWEDIFGENTPVFRKVSGIVGAEVDVQEKNNLVVVLSHAYKSIGRDLKEEMNEEAKKIHEAIMEENNQQYRIEGLSFIKHCTREAISSINWGNFNLAHFIMHGDSEGGIYLEKADHSRYKDVDPLNAENLLDLLRGHNLRLIFLSLCYSGGGSKANCLAFQIVKEGLSQYTVGYSGKVGDRSARIFSSYFYKNLMNGEGIEKAYTNSLSSYLRDPGVKPGKYVPLLYIR